MKTKLRPVLSIAFLCLLSEVGCDYEHGMVRESKYRGVPDIDCISSVLRNESGVQNIDIDGTDTVYITYELRGTPIWLVYGSKYKPTIFHKITVLNGYPDCVKVEDVSPYLAKIEKAIETKCRLETHSLRVTCHALQGITFHRAAIDP